MSPRIRALLAVLLLAAAGGAAWILLSREPAPAPAAPPSLPPPRPAVPAEVPREIPPVVTVVDGCPTGFRDAEVFPGELLDEAWAMCRLFGNFDAASRASRTSTELASIALSRPFTEGNLPRHVLVVVRQAARDGAPVVGARATASLDAHVFVRDAAGWRREATGADLAAAGVGGRTPGVQFQRAGRDRHALLVTPAGGQEEGPVRLVGISEGRVSVLTDELPAGGASEPGCVPHRCFDWTASIEFTGGAGEWYDLLVHVRGSRPDDDERVWPVDERTRWVYRSGRYLPER